MEDNKLFHFNKKQVVYLIGSACCLIFGIVFSVLENGKGSLGEFGNISAVIGTIICSNIFCQGIDLDFFGCKKCMKKCKMNKILSSAALVLLIGIMYFVGQMLENKLFTFCGVVVCVQILCFI